MGANHKSGIGCPYPYVDENNVAKEKPQTNKKDSKKDKKSKKD
jgi:hypothetical protein